MFARDISKTSVTSAILLGEIIMEYSDDQPYPSYLVLWFNGETPVHVVIAQNKEDDSCYVITAYIPSEALWEVDFKTRKPS